MPGKAQEARESPGKPGKGPGEAREGPGRPREAREGPGVEGKHNHGLNCPPRVPPMDFLNICNSRLGSLVGNWAGALCFSIYSRPL